MSLYMDPDTKEALRLLLFVALVLIGLAYLFVRDTPTGLAPSTPVAPDAPVSDVGGTDG